MKRNLPQKHQYISFHLMSLWTEKFTACIYRLLFFSQQRRRKWGRLEWGEKLGPRSPLSPRQGEREGERGRGREQTRGDEEGQRQCAGVSIRSHASEQGLLGRRRMMALGLSNRPDLGEPGSPNETLP